jgi:hypothetical protein
MHICIHTYIHIPKEIVFSMFSGGTNFNFEVVCGCIGTGVKRVLQSIATNWRTWANMSMQARRACKLGEWGGEHCSRQRSQMVDSNFIRLLWMRCSLVTACIYDHVCICIRICMCVYIHRWHIYIHTHTYTHIYICAHIHTYVFSYVYIHIWRMACVVCTVA